mgnify:CR=1 FL=1
MDRKDPVIIEELDSTGYYYYGGCKAILCR